MELKEKHCWAEIDVDAIRSNYELIKYTLEKPFYTVVKADAYGHGAKYIAKIYSEMDTFGFCVSNFSEAMELRNSGITKPILILGYTEPNKAYELFKNNLTQTVFSLEYAKALNDQALYPIECHIKLDTGMGRLGFDLLADKEKAYSEIRALLNMHNLKCTGVYSHFPAADALDDRALVMTQKQVEIFGDTVRLMESWGFNLKTMHGQNSAGIARKLNGKFNTMRAGIILYGVNPSEEVIFPQIKPAMSLKTIVTHIKTVKAGQSVSYGMNWTATQDTKVATVAAGYADGVSRILGFTGHKVKIGDRFYPVIGNICMDQMMIDITDSDVKIGDEVTVWGGEGESAVEKVAAKAYTIPYEMMCGVSKRVPRVYKENNRIVHIEYGI